MIKRIGGTFFDIDFCKGFTPERLMLIYKNESQSTLTLLIAECYPKGEGSEAEKPNDKKAKQKK